jgi:cobalamin biosynthesis Mg chelatase CobN
MEQNPHPAPVERVERTEIIERSSSSGQPDTRKGSSPMWAWVLPLVLIVLVLAYYIFTRG